jgi:nucleoside-diphosphate-sugar epimerase
LKILFIGCGDIAQRTAALLGDSHDCFGLRRNPQQLPASIVPIAGDVTDTQQLQSVVAQGFDIWIATLTPPEFSEQGYRDSYLAAANSILDVALQTQKSPQLILWISSTSVYGDCAGTWVDESTTPVPEKFSGKILLQAEQVIQQIPCSSIVRFSGIYGRGRSRLINQVLEGKGRPEYPEQWSNRIHSDDCAGVLAHLVERFVAGRGLEQIYLASDCQPVTQHRLRKWLAEQLSVDLFEELAGSPATRRCGNQRLLDSGYCFKYPSYREGYLELLRR